MPANFESGVTFGEQSWHGDEVNLPADHPARYDVAECIKLAEMEWEVTKAEMEIAKGHPMAGTAAPGLFGIYRTDRWQYLGAARAGYECLQNLEIFERFQPLLDLKELSFESVGALDHGRRVYVQARLAAEDYDLGGGDRIKPYLLIVGSHDCSMSTKIGFTPIRTVCQNTVSAALNSKASQLLSVRHTKGQKPALDNIMAVVDAAKGEFVANCKQYELLKNAPINQKELARFVRRVLAMEVDANWSEFSKRKLETYNQLIHLALGGLGNDELSAWTAYNGVTEWTSHHKGKTQADRLKSVWFGDSAAINQRALGLALAMAT